MKKEEGKFEVAAKAIIKKDDKYLILERSETDPYKPGEGDIPGGKIEFGEKVLDGMLREVMEESNLDIDVIRPLRTWSFLRGNSQLVGITYLAEYKSGEVKLSWEHSSFQWLTFNEIINGDLPEWLKKDFSLI